MLASTHVYDRNECGESHGIACLVILPQQIDVRPLLDVPVVGQQVVWGLLCGEVYEVRQQSGRAPVPSTNG